MSARSPSRENVRPTYFCAGARDPDSKSPHSVQDVILDVLANPLVVSIPNEQARRPILDHGWDRVLGSLELHLPVIVVVEERGRDLLDLVSLLERRQRAALYGRSRSHGIAVERDGSAE